MLKENIFSRNDRYLEEVLTSIKGYLKALIYLIHSDYFYLNFETYDIWNDVLAEDLSVDGDRNFSEKIEGNGAMVFQEEDKLIINSKRLWILPSKTTYHKGRNLNCYSYQNFFLCVKNLNNNMFCGHILIES